MRIVSLVIAVFLLVSCASAPRGTNDERLIANADPIKIAKIGLGTEKPFSAELDSNEVVVTFHPRTNLVSFDFRYQLLQHRLFITEAGRTALASAVAAYVSAYDERSLNVREKRPRAVFGKHRSRLVWGLVTTGADARPELEFGYSFRDPRSPYFTITIPKSENIPGRDTSIDIDDYSLEITFYFTKGQAQALAEAIKQETLIAALDPVDRQEPKKEPVEEYTTK